MRKTSKSDTHGKAGRSPARTCRGARSIRGGVVIVTFEKSAASGLAGTTPPAGGGTVLAKYRPPNCRS
jgi:hypothetical protein